jgi:hypothetical protein
MTKRTTPPLVGGLIGVGGAGLIFATNIVANGATTGRTVVQSVIHIAVVIPTAITKVLNIVIDKR